jgi:hypothetical protein
VATAEAACVCAIGSKLCLKTIGTQHQVADRKLQFTLDAAAVITRNIRRECFDHMIVFHERSLKRHLRCFLDYYHRSRTHLGLQKDTPDSRPVQAEDAGPIVSIPEVGGLHHRYERRAAS